MSTPIQLDPNNAIRFLVPGFLIIGFVAWRFGIALQIVPLQILIITASFVSGAITYAIYRALLLPPIRWIEFWLGGVPQYRFHQDILKAMHKKGERIPSGLRNLSAVHECYQTVLKQVSQAERAESMFFNTLTHILYMGAFLSLIFLTLDVLRPPAGDDIPYHLPWAVVWASMSIVLFVAGILMDRQADAKEVAILRQRERQYKKEIRLRIERR